MSYRVGYVNVEATVIASTRARVAWSDLALEIPTLFDRIYEFLRSEPPPAQQRGHNVCIYHAPSAAGCDLEVGVQVAAPFAGNALVICSQTPSGRAASTVHLGGYDGLGKAHDALTEWCKAQGFSQSGPSWEVYGDWSDDPAQRRTDVFRLLPPEG